MFISRCLDAGEKNERGDTLKYSYLHNRTMSENSHALNIHLKLTVRDAEGNVLGTNEMDNDIANDNLANLMAVAMLAGAAGTFQVNDETATPQSVTLPIVSFDVEAGSGVAGVARTDTALQATFAPNAWGIMKSQSLNSSTIISGGSFTITGYFLNDSGGVLTYGEVAIIATDSTLVPVVFLLTHDRTNGATGFSVPDNGTMDAVYTVTYS